MQLTLTKLHKHSWHVLAGIAARFPRFVCESADVAVAFGRCRGDGGSAWIAYARQNADVGRGVPGCDFAVSREDPGRVTDARLGAAERGVGGEEATEEALKRGREEVEAAAQFSSVVRD